MENNFWLSARHCLLKLIHSFQNVIYKELYFYFNSKFNQRRPEVNYDLSDICLKSEIRIN